MTVKERLTAFVDWLNISKSEFCRQIDVSSAFISSIRVSIQQDKIQRIALKYPELNIEWLLTGRGKMLKEESNSLKEDTISGYGKPKESLNDFGSKESLLRTIQNLSETVNRQSKKIEDLENELKEIKKAALVNKDDVKGAAAS